MALICWICIIYSKYRDINAIKIGMLAFQFRVLLNVFYVSDILSTSDPVGNLSKSLIQFMNILVHQNFMGFIFDKYKTHLNVFSAVILVFAWNYRIYGFQNIKEDILPMLFTSLCLLAGTIVAILVN